MEEIKGFSELTAAQQEIFVETHKAHLSILRTETKKKYSIDNIQKVEWDNKGKCVKVYYQNGDSYHYEDTNWYE